MALKSTYASEEKGAEIEEALDVVDKLVDRVKVLYEQYFMGIQKAAPAHLHNDAERRVRDLTQMSIRNTALRYRFATIQQKYGAYNTYWKRTLREIEAGRYMRNLSKLRRQAQVTGEAIPDEIVAKMPKRMREAVARDREQALAKAAREGMIPGGANEAYDELAQDSDTQPEVPRFAAPPSPLRRGGAHTLDDPFADGGDISSALADLADEALAAVERPSPKPAAAAPVVPPRPPRATATPPPTPPPMPAARAAIPPIPTMPRPGNPATPPPRPAVPSTPPPRAPTVPGAATPPPRPAAPRPAVPSPIPGMSEADTRTLYAKYVKAREVVGDRTDPMSYDKLVRTLSSQAPRILEQHRATGVEFNVVIKDNKVVLKAKPK